MRAQSVLAKQRAHTATRQRDHTWSRIGIPPRVHDLLCAELCASQPERDLPRVKHNAHSSVSSVRVPAMSRARPARAHRGLVGPSSRSLRAALCLGLPEHRAALGACASKLCLRSPLSRSRCRAEPFCGPAKPLCAWACRCTERSAVCGLISVYENTAYIVHQYVQHIQYMVVYRYTSMLHIP